MGQDGGVIGPIAILLVLLVFIPVGVILTGAAIAGLLGFSLKKDADERNEGTEHVALGG